MDEIYVYLRGVIFLFSSKSKKMTVISKKHRKSCGMEERMEEMDQNKKQKTVLGQEEAASGKVRQGAAAADSKTETVRKRGGGGAKAGEPGKKESGAAKESNRGKKEGGAAKESNRGKKESSAAKESNGGRENSSKEKANAGRRNGAGTKRAASKETMGADEKNKGNQSAEGKSKASRTLEGKESRGGVQRSGVGAKRSTGTKSEAKTAVKTAAPSKDAASSVKIIPLGGLDKIGMNITAIEYGDTIIVVDCGISFPEEDMLGIDKVIPDISYLVQNRDRVKGFVITHGHEDHIGALPYILPQLNVPVYGTRLTMGLIEHKLEEAGILRKVKRRVVKQGGYVNLGEIRVEFIKTNHSIAGASALAIYTPAGVILHTGDFKVDYTPLFGDPIDLQRMAVLGKKGVLAVMNDSTNAMRAGFTPSETKVAKTFDLLFAENTKSRIIVATFASNVDRVQQIINTAHKYDRKVILQGRSMENVIEIAQKLGYVTVPEGTMIDVGEMNRYPDEKLVFITTGSQGEAMAALSRMADGTHKKVHIKPNDAIVFSSTPIPGNEKAVSKIMNELAMRGARTIIQDTHVSGHACQEEIKLIYSLLKPKYAIPVHGEYRHLMASASLAMDLGIPKDHIFVLEAGDVLELSEQAGRVTEKVSAKGIFVDGLGVGDVGNIVIRDRQNLSENGIIIVTMTIERGSDKLASGPDIITRGFVYVRESGELLNEMRSVAYEAFRRCEKQKVRDWGKIKNAVRDQLNDYLWKKIKRKPVIIPIITEV